MKKRISHGMLAMLLLVLAAQGNGQHRGESAGQTPQNRQIVFVCEHGAALSVVSAAYFNKLAKEEHLNLHAIARGTSPQQDIAVSAEKGLREDGVASETKRPEALSEKDVTGSVRIVAFCAIPVEYSKVATVVTWNDVPPTGVDYAAARDVILRHVRELIRDLKEEERRR